MSTIDMTGKSFLIAACASALLGLSGCANYKLGTTLSDDLRDVYIPNVKNESGQPGVEIEVTKAIIKEIQREGTLRIVPEERASTRLDVIVVAYRQDSIRYNSRNNDLPEEYRMVLRASSTFTNLNADDPEKAVIAQNVSEGDETFLRGTDTITARQRGLPKAAAELAEQIVEDCVSAW
jgi:hypothetical protein